MSDKAYITELHSDGLISMKLNLPIIWLKPISVGGSVLFC